MGREARVGGEEADAVVAPVIDQAALHQEAIRDVVVHGQQLDGGDPEPLEMSERWRRREPTVGAAQMRGHLGMHDGEALDVDLVDQRPLERRLWWRVVTPVIGAIHDHALGEVRSGVALVEPQVQMGVAQRVAKEAVGDRDGAVDPARIRVEQQLVGVEPMALARRVRALHAKAIALTRAQIGKVAVPDEVGAVGQPDALLPGTLRVEEAQLDGAGVLAVDRDVDPLAIPRQPQRIGRSPPDLHRLGKTNARLYSTRSSCMGETEGRLPGSSFHTLNAARLPSEYSRPATADNSPLISLGMSGQ